MLNIEVGKRFTARVGGDKDIREVGYKPPHYEEQDEKVVKRADIASVYLKFDVT